jgi:RNA-splicing ligase RtcB
MYTIKGAYADALITIDNLDPNAVNQLYGLLNAKTSEGAKVAIMPDGHPGKDCLVGFTQKFNEDAEVRLVPNFVGGDIACGVFAWPIGTATPDLNALDDFIRRNIPNGSRGYADVVNRFATDQDRAVFNEADERLSKFETHVFGQDQERIPAVMQLCSLGSGNHFISLERSEKTGEIYLLIHSGSRQFGKSVCKVFQKMAAGQHPTGNAKGLEYLSPWDDGFEAYLDFMDIGIRLAARNKEIMAQEIMTFLGVEEKKGAIKTNHNYYDRNERTIRKGAVSAKADELFLCPINMRDGTFICRGKGNNDWNESAPHGAGRLMSRADAKELLDIESVRATLGDLFTTTVDSSLDEAPDAYKSFDFIREHITPTADIVDRLVPLYNFKG